LSYSPALDLTGTWNGSITFQGGPVTGRASMPAGAFTAINSTWTPACVGVISAFATQNGQVALSK
jgi:hypothetical protein